MEEKIEKSIETPKKQEVKKEKPAVKFDYKLPNMGFGTVKIGEKTYNARCIKGKILVNGTEVAMEKITELVINDKKIKL